MNLKSGDMIRIISYRDDLGPEGTIRTHLWNDDQSGTIGFLEENEIGIIISNKKYKYHEYVEVIIDSGKRGWVLGSMIESIQCYPE